MVLIACFACLVLCVIAFELGGSVWLLSVACGVFLVVVYLVVLVVLGVDFACYYAYACGFDAPGFLLVVCSCYLL